MMEFEHITDTGEGHGPVAAFLADSGRIAFVCRRDGAYWEGDMPQLTPPGSRKGTSGDEVRTDAGPDYRRDFGVDAGAELGDGMSLADARDLAVARMAVRGGVPPRGVTQGRRVRHRGGAC